MYMRWNERTPYSRLFAIILFVGILPMLSFYLGVEYENTRNTLLSESADFSLLPAAAHNSRAQWKLYENAEYSFAIAYPPEVTPETSFTKLHGLGEAWRVGASSEGAGILAIPLSRIDEKKGERYYDAELRIGASGDPEAVAACLVSPSGEAGEEYAFGDVLFRAFPVKQEGSTGIIAGTSYRTVHEGRCVALEELESFGAKEEVPEFLHDDFERLHSLTETFRFLPR